MFRIKSELRNIPEPTANNRWWNKEKERPVWEILISVFHAFCLVWLKKAKIQPRRLRLPPTANMKQQSSSSAAWHSNLASLTTDYGHFPKNPSMELTASQQEEIWK